MSMQRNATNTEENHATRFLPVLDSRKRKIRGLIRRGDRYYAQLRVDIGNGQSKPKRIPLTATTLDQAKAELEKTRNRNREGKLPTTGHRPMFSDFADEFLKKLAHADFRDYGGHTDEFNKTPWFHFHAEAKTLFEDWLAANEEKTDNKNEDPALREHLSKFPKLFCSLSLIFHLIELADTGKHETYIPLRIAQMAAEWCAYLESHARRIYSLVKTPSLFSAMALADKITDPSTKTPLENGFTTREVFRRKWSGADTYELIHAALARLEEANWIRGVVVPPSKNGGRPTVHYEINPEIIHRRDARKEAE
jgi:Protein of unknown function (DUF3987)